MLKNCVRQTMKKNVIEKTEQVNSVDPDDRNDMSHLDIHCLPRHFFRSAVFKMINSLTIKLLNIFILKKD